MMNKTKLRKGLCSLCMLCLGGALADAQANCVRNNFSDYPALPLMDWGSAQLWFGRINLTNTTLQPVGTILGATVATAGSAPGITDETLLWTCDIADKDKIYEVFATNGDDRVGGFWDSGAKDGIPGFYETWFPYVGIKITHVKSGKVFTRNWQYEPLRDYDTDSSGTKILIKAKHLSPVKAELARVSTDDNGAGYSNWCGAPTRYRPGSNSATIYTCEQPNAYITLRGPGYTAQSDEEGYDSARYYNFFGWRNGVAFGMRQAASLSYAPTCVVRNATPEVSFWPITALELALGETREANFTIQLECDRNVDSGNGVNQTALGIQVSAATYAKAQELNLVTAAGGVSYLLSDNYGADPSVATGVGISIRDTDTGQPMNFLGWPGYSGSGFLNGPTRISGGVPLSFPAGSGAGWYPVFSGASPSGDAQTLNYSRVITATLARLPGKTPTPGRVNATAYVVVKVQ